MTNEMEILREKCARLEKDNLAKAVQIADLQDELGAARHKHKAMREIMHREREENATLSDKLQATEYLLEERTRDIILMEESHAEEIGVLKEKLRKEKELNANALKTVEIMKETCVKKCTELLDRAWKAEEQRDALSDCVDGLLEEAEDMERTISALREVNDDWYSITDDFITQHAKIQELCDDWKFRAMDSQNEDLLRFIFKIQDILD